MGLKDFTITEDGRIIRDSFVFYRSWYDTVRMLSQEKGFQLFTDISEYGLNGIEPEYDEMLTPIFINIKPNIDANTKKALDGGKGGRPKKNESERGDRPKKKRRKEDDATIEEKKEQAKEILRQETEKITNSI